MRVAALNCNLSLRARLEHTTGVTTLAFRPQEVHEDVQCALPQAIVVSVDIYIERAEERVVVSSRLYRPTNAVVLHLFVGMPGYIGFIETSTRVLLQEDARDTIAYALCEKKRKVLLYFNAVWEE